MSTYVESNKGVIDDLEMILKGSCRDLFENPWFGFREGIELRNSSRQPMSRSRFLEMDSHFILLFHEPYFWVHLSEPLI
jgi:hypothetical protein